jgi:hypothetical protein
MEILIMERNYSGMLIGLPIAILYFLGTNIRTSRLRVFA